MNFNHKKFLAKWGDAKRLRWFMKSYGIEPPSWFAIDKWYARESVPVEWFAIILVLMEMEASKPISLLPFLDEPTEAAGG
jgi:hypothetical protein